jgi:hypothetical protein
MAGVPGRPPVSQAAARDIVAALWHELCASPDDAGGTVGQGQGRVARDAVWHVCSPFEDEEGGAILGEWFGPMREALGIDRCRLSIVIAGVGPGDMVTVSVTGHLLGTHRVRWVGIPGTGAPVSLRFGAIHRVAPDGRVGESWVLLDILDLAHRAGVPNLPGRYDRHPVGDPASGDGVLSGGGGHAGDGGPGREDDGSPGREGSQESLALVEAMIDGLMSYDGADLRSMGMERFWTADMRWYGPGGIGSSRSLRGFEDLHQRAFLAAFPDRVGGGPNHVARFADGPYVGTGGWPSVRATHSGAPYLGVAARGGRVEMRVMDWWRREGDLLHENWVLIDMPHLLAQLGHPLLVDGELRPSGVRHG